MLIVAVFAGQVSRNLPLLVAPGAPSVEAPSLTWQVSAAVTCVADGRTGLESCVNFFQEFENLFVSRGGTVLHGVSGNKIMTDETGAICGLRCVRPTSLLTT